MYFALDISWHNRPLCNIITSGTQNGHNIKNMHLFLDVRTYTVSALTGDRDLLKTRNLNHYMQSVYTRTCGMVSDCDIGEDEELRPR